MGIVICIYSVFAVNSILLSYKVKKYLSENKDVIMNNPYISEKNKKLFTIYTASSHNFKLYSATKSYAKSVKQ